MRPRIIPRAAAGRGIDHGIDDGWAPGSLFVMPRVAMLRVAETPKRRIIRSWLIVLRVSRWLSNQVR